MSRLTQAPVGVVILSLAFAVFVGACATTTIAANTSTGEKGSLVAVVVAEGQPEPAAAPNDRGGDNPGSERGADPSTPPEKGNDSPPANGNPAPSP